MPALVDSSLRVRSDKASSAFSMYGGRALSNISNVSGGGGGKRRPSSRQRLSADKHSDDELLARSEVVQVELMPPDDNWGENTTCLTGNTSEHSCSYDDFRRLKDFAQVDGMLILGSRFLPCCRFPSAVVSIVTCLVSVCSPTVMVAMPKLSPLVTSANVTWYTTPCSSDCEGLLINFAVKMVILLFGLWALFFRRSTEVLPRLFISRAFLLAFVFLVIFAYWLFYIVRILQPAEPNFTNIVTFALSFLDALLFMHYLALIILEIRHLKPIFRVHVVRSPDGVSRTYSLGYVSVQRAAALILQNYYRDFAVYNPYLEALPIHSKKGSSNNKLPVTSFKIYDVDAGSESVNPQDVNTQAIIAAAARKRDAGHNERFYDEMEWERRVKKRRARLVTAVEESFSHVKRVGGEKAIPNSMTAYEAAQAIFPSIARTLQKYLRVTRQQPRHTADQVLQHLSQYLAFDMSPKAFLERFFNGEETTEGMLPEVNWSIVCSELISKDISHGLIFQLRCHSPGPDAGVYLLCSVGDLPFLNLTEERCSSRMDNFALRLSSETSV